MEPVTIRLPDDTHRTLADEAKENDMSMSAVAREYVRKGMEYDDLKTENERLQRQLATTNARQDDVDEVVEYVEREKQMQQRREERQSAPVWTRARRWIFGYETDTDATDAES